jgi:hypothetical protein
MRVCPKVSRLSHNEIYAYNNKLSLRSDIKGYGGKTRSNDSQNSDTTASIGRELYYLQFSLQAANPETFGYTFVFALLVIVLQVDVTLKLRRFIVRDLLYARNVEHRASPLFCMKPSECASDVNSVLQACTDECLVWTIILVVA